MVENNKSSMKRQSYTGIGIALGFGVGTVLGGLPLSGNIGWAVDAGLGLVLGLIVGSIAES